MPVDGKFISGSGVSVAKKQVKHPITNKPIKQPPVKRKPIENATPRYFKNASEISQVKSNKKNIASEMASDMIDDWKRWAKEDGDETIDKHLKIDGKKVTEDQMKKHLTNEIIKRIDTNVGDGSEENEIVKWKDGDFTFYIDGLPEFSDSQPLYVDYNPKAKKITMWGYV